MRYLNRTKAIGENTADNAFVSTSVVSNRDGSVLERTEFIISDLVGIDTDMDEVLSHVLNLSSNLVLIHNAASDIVSAASILKDMGSDLVLIHNAASDLISAASSLKDVRSDIIAMNSELLDIRSDIVGAKLDITEILSHVIDISSDCVNISNIHSHVIDIQSDLVGTKSTLLDIKSDIVGAKVGITEILSHVIDISSDCVNIANIHSHVINIASDLISAMSQINDIASDVVLVGNIHSHLLNVQSDLVGAKSSLLDLRSDIEVILAGGIYSMEFWGACAQKITVDTTISDINLPSVTIADLPTTATIARAIAMFRFRMVDNLNAGANACLGAAQIQVRTDAPGTLRNAITIPDNFCTFAAVGTSFGGDLMGDSDIAIEVTGNDTYHFKWMQADADADSLEFEEIQTGLKIWFDA